MCTGHCSFWPGLGNGLACAFPAFDPPNSIIISLRFLHYLSIWFAHKGSISFLFSHTPGSVQNLDQWARSFVVFPHAFSPLVWRSGACRSMCGYLSFHLIIQKVLTVAGKPQNLVAGPPSVCTFLTGNLFAQQGP